MLQWLNNAGVIRCPRCQEPAEYGNCVWNSDGQIVRGDSQCRHCVTRSMTSMPSLLSHDEISTYSGPSTIPLTFDWEYDILSGQVETVGHGFEQNYFVEPNFGGHINRPAYNRQTTTEYQQQPESTTMNVFVIRRRDARNIIVDVLTTQRQAEREYGDRSALEILPYECEHPTFEGGQIISFKVWLVTVGKGDSTRIVGVFTTKKEAAKVAAPIQGRIRELEAVPRRRQVRNISVYKSFVSMNDGPSEYDRSQLVDRVSVRRKLYEGEEAILFPVATFKRRYSSSLPHRIEILAVSERTAKDVARQFGRMSDEAIIEMLEYNVDYRLLNENNEWSFDPCLLNQPV